MRLSLVLFVKLILFSKQNYKIIYSGFWNTVVSFKICYNVDEIPWKLEFMC